MQYLDDEWETFKQVVLAAARNVSQGGDHRLIVPYTDVKGAVTDKPVRIGLFGNMANQAYITAKALRRLGHRVDVVVQPNIIDLHHLSQPFWEEVDREVHDTDVQIPPADWMAPDYCRIIQYDLDLQLSAVDMANRLGFILPQALYRLSPRR